MMSSHRWRVAGVLVAIAAALTIAIALNLGARHGSSLQVASSMRPPLAAVRDEGAASPAAIAAPPAAREQPPLEEMEGVFLRQNDGHNPWAAAAERDLSAAMREFAQGSHLQLPAAMEVSCGGAMCRIKLPLAERRDMSEWGETFPLAIGEILPVITFVPRFQADGSVVLYAFGRRDGGPHSGK